MLWRLYLRKNAWMKNSVNSINLSKRFGQKKILKNVNFSAISGECVLLYGNNGAGKSTFLRTLSGTIPKETGQVFINNFLYNPNDLNQRLQLGLLLENDWLYDSLTIFENLQFWSQIMKNNSNIDSLISFFEINEYKDYPLSKCSQGIRQRTGLVRAFLHEPQIILLDEPYTFLDSNGIILLNNWIEKQKQQQKIIIIASHDYDKSSKIITRTDLMKDNQILQNIDIKKRRGE